MRPRQVRRQLRKAVRYQALSEVIGLIDVHKATPPFPANSDQCSVWLETMTHAQELLARARVHVHARVYDTFGARGNRADELGIATTHDLAG